MTLFEKWKRATRRRFKMSYRRSLKQVEERYEKTIEELNERRAAHERALRVQHAREIEHERAKAGALAREIARVRLEVGPKQYTTRFTLYATLDESFMLGARNLKDMMPYVIKVLVAMMEREFAQVDFNRLKPIDPGPRPTKYPTFRVDSDDPSFDDMRSW